MNIFPAYAWNTDIELQLMMQSLIVVIPIDTRALN